MQPNVHRVRTYFASQAEASRFLAIHPHQEGSEDAFALGVKVAEEGFIPALREGRYGTAERRLDKLIRVFARGIAKATGRGEDGLSPDLQYCVRVGYENHARNAKEAYLKEVAEAAAAKAFVEAADVGFQLIDHLIAQSRPRPVGPPGLSPGGTSVIHCPLRPEDFGALPTGRRP